jgi:formylglycine-generating enzyme required for sulfatase activity
MMSMRSDFFGELQKDEALYGAHRQVNVPPLREPQLREVVSRPADLLSARFENDELAAYIARGTAEESNKDAGALPLLSYLLDDMWKQMVKREDGVLRLPGSVFDLGGVLVKRADEFIAAHQNSDDMLRRIFTLRLVTVREGEEPTRRRARRSDFSENEWRLVSELANDPNRLLVTATSEAHETYAEVAHETIFKRWDKLKQWIAAEREFLAWKTGLETARRAWENAPVASKSDALLMGFALAQAVRWSAKRSADIAQIDLGFIELSRKTAQRIEADREFLAWKTGFEAARRAWQARPDNTKSDVLLKGFALDQAKNWLTKRHEDLSVADRDFIDQSAERERKTRARARRVQALVYVLLVGMITGLVGWINQAYVKELWNWYTTWYTTWYGYVLRAAAERALEPGDVFRECAKDCPEMIVVAAGEFLMGSPATEKGRFRDEDPQRRVMIARRFAVSKFDVTFADWDACVSVGGCPQEGRAKDEGWGRDTRPVINVSWDDAQQYVAWLSKMTRKPYRLLTEAEWEYAARAGSTTAYYWGDEIGKQNANCNGCGSEWDNRQTSAVGSFKPNAFGLYDMAGNVFQWVEDCYHGNYDGAPLDGSVWIAGDCRDRVARGGSWFHTPGILRSASRDQSATDSRFDNLGFRVARTLLPP